MDYQEFTFYQSLKRLIKKEKSNYGKLVLQENLIFEESIMLLHFIKGSLYWNRSPFELEIPKNIYDHQLSEMIKILALFFGNNDELILKFKTYTPLRNSITHKIFSKYKTMKRLNSDAKKVITEGEKLLKYIQGKKDYIKTTMTFEYRDGPTNPEK